MKQKKLTGQTKIEDQIGLLVHSYNNYLAGIMGYSELASLENNNKEVQEFLTQSQKSCKEAVYFSKTLLASLGRLQVRLQNESLIGLLQSVSKTVNSLALNSDFSESLSVNTNADWFKDCIGDLIDFLKIKNTQIRMTAKISENRNTAMVEIKADLVELAENDLKCLFDIFHSSRVMQGTKDVGLAKAYGFFSQMNAMLSWKNGVGFTLQLKLASD